MRAITKGNEPYSLATYRAQNNPASKTAFRDYPDKDELRRRLVVEQKGLCCYCMNRIQNDPLKMKIDHWQCQDRYQAVRLSYSNLLGACLGGSGLVSDHKKRDKDTLHCDSRKGNADLKWNPAMPAHRIETRIYYLADGTIKSFDDEFNDQLNSVLNLNVAVLKNSRKAILDALLFWWRSTKDARDKVQQQIDRRTGIAAEYQPFSPVAVWFLRQKLVGATP